ncbi:hypothetical protein FIBSPDRAFT_96158 [Athelia psychrophila]|uniref:Secreted protein n=1 Tax=Athelia psychrophila TaxID=1759441 RepID=A0A166DTC6_9AGAM|nr:hypothetical protein FIBSPDRAFT_96158 [Fibularhizoctonia sp. CBS 109695]
MRTSAFHTLFIMYLAPHPLSIFVRQADCVSAVLRPHERFSVLKPVVSIGDMLFFIMVKGDGWSANSALAFVFQILILPNHPPNPQCRYPRESQCP